MTTQWLFDCVSQWRKLDETPYLIEVEPEQQKAQQPGANSPKEVTFEEAPTGDLSSSEEELADGSTDSEGAAQAALAVDTAVGPRLRVPGPGEEVQQAGQEQNDEDERSLSPADNVTDDQWQAMMAEIDEASDTEDGGDTDGDGNESDGSTVSVKGGGEGESKKRKRNGDSVAPSTDGEEDESATNGNSKVESKLQQRKRRALERTSSLTNVKHAKDSNGVPQTSSLSASIADDTAADLGSSQVQAPASEAGTDDGDDGFNAALQAELEAQLNAEDDE